MIVKIILEGIAGTAFMTAVMYTLAYFAGDQFKVVKVLGTMLTFQTTEDRWLSNATSAIVVGVIAHYLVGIGFAFVYQWLWSDNLVGATMLNATWMGFLNGVVGAVGWRIFFFIHSKPPRIALPLYLTAIAIGHIFFAYGILAVYKWLPEM